MAFEKTKLVPTLTLKENLHILLKIMKEMKVYSQGFIEFQMHAVVLSSLFCIMLGFLIHRLPAVVLALSLG